jgi:O-antigen/teichoic acid export membrane protein
MLGFVAMVYFARELGSGTLGVYFLVVALVGWLKLGNNMGISLALNKRISEGEDKSQHLIAALSVVVAAFVVISTGVYILRGQVNDYLGGNLHYYVILLLGAKTMFMIVKNAMKGEHLVHAQGLVSLPSTTLRIVIQATAVVFGLGATGLLFGEAIAAILSAIGATVLTLTYFGRSVRLRLPTKEHYFSLINYAKFSWLSSMKGKIYQRADIIILGFFVTSNLVGIYAICWNISRFLEIFTKSLSTTLFPEMSKVSSEEGVGEVAPHTENALAYSGLMIIPGLVGATVVGNGILNIYGAEFRQGHNILVTLVGSGLIHGYYKQLVNTMDAVNRPDLTFAVNIFFAITNIILNLILVYLYGWIGAAIATLVSVGVSTVLAYSMLSRILDFSVPYMEILKQVLSASVMGALVYTLLRILGLLGLGREMFVSVFVAVGFGALVYFACLLLVSERFRNVVSENLGDTGVYPKRK